MKLKIEIMQDVYLADLNEHPEQEYVYNFEEIIWQGHYRGAFTCYIRRNSHGCNCGYVCYH